MCELMVSDTLPVVVLENASVCYRSPDEAFLSFKEFAIRLVQNRVKMKDFWALKDINLEVQKGEKLGIIGRNGAGKSTLLKLVSRVLSPTSGRIITRGQVAPLLELGAGFHTELTGRENVFLNGALLGHSQKEIKEHLADILDFAQIDGYIDSPLRTYSSGMIARLGFAVATSWTPEILILDEILAVGDEEFQVKCFSKIDEFRTGGTTIFLVTHNLDTILTKCDRAVWLDQGQIMKNGSVQSVVDSYLENIQTSESGRHGG
jgi:ABC-type polysaccharide/polyol phosphate transport system ATPase subunit